MSVTKQIDDSSGNVWYTPKSLASQLQVSTGTVIGWICSGQLRAINVARNLGGRPRWRIDPQFLQQFMLARQSQAFTTRESKHQIRSYRSPRPVSGVNRRLAENIPHEVRVKKSALAMANHKGGQFSEWRPFVPIAIERYEQKHGVRVKEEDVVILKAWWEDLQ